MMQFKPISTPDDLEAMPVGTVIGGSIETYVRTANGWCACTLEEFCQSAQLFNYLPVGMVTGTRQVQVYYKP